MSFPFFNNPKTPGEILVCGTFLVKFLDFGVCITLFTEKQLFWGSTLLYDIIVMPIHTLDVCTYFGMFGKMRPISYTMIPIRHMGGGSVSNLHKLWVVTTPLVNCVTEKGWVRWGLALWVQRNWIITLLPFSNKRCCLLVKLGHALLDKLYRDSSLHLIIADIPGPIKHGSMCPYWNVSLVLLVNTCLLGNNIPVMRLFH